MRQNVVDYGLILCDSMGMKTTTIDGIEWAECPSFPGYATDASGRIINNRGRLIKQHKGWINKRATFYMKASICKDGVKKQYGVHRIVADAWLGPCPEGLEVDHKDFDKSNNKPDNLQYVTHQENMRRAVEAGRWPDRHGELSSNWGRHPDEATRLLMRQAKLGARHWRAVKPDVDRIRALRQDGLTDAAIADQLGLKRTTVGGVLRGTHWSVRAADVSQPPVNPQSLHLSTISS